MPAASSLASTSLVAAPNSSRTMMRELAMRPARTRPGATSEGTPAKRDRNFSMKSIMCAWGWPRTTWTVAATLGPATPPLARKSMKLSMASSRSRRIASMFSVMASKACIVASSSVSRRRAPWKSSRIASLNSLMVARAWPPKTSRSRRTIDLPASLVTILGIHKKRQTEDLLALGRPDRLELVVCRSDGKPFQPRSLAKEFARTIKRHGLARVRFHDLRHSHIALGLMAGVHPKIMSARAGHASVSIALDTYSHAVPSLQKDAACSIDALLRPAIEHKMAN